MPEKHLLISSTERKRKMKSLLDQVMNTLRNAKEYCQRHHDYLGAQRYIEAMHGVEALYKYCYIDPRDWSKGLPELPVTLKGID